MRAYVSAVWGCPYEGEVSVDRVLEVAERHLELGAYEVSLGDTIGVGNPLQTRRILERLLARLPKERLAMHMHDTREMAMRRRPLTKAITRSLAVTTLVP